MQTDDRAELRRRIREILEEHTADHPITMIALFQAITGEVVIPWRRYDQSRIVRSLVEELRREGMPVAHKSSAGGGYYIARNAKELQPTVDWFHVRALSSLRQEAALRRMRPGELVKQYELELNRQEQNDGEA